MLKGQARIPNMWFRYSSIPVLLLISFLASTTMGQIPGSLPSKRAVQTSDGEAHGVYLFVLRTPAHIHFSSFAVCEQVKDTVSQYLSEHQIEVRKVDESPCSAIPGENLIVTDIGDFPDVLQRARLAGASHVLFLTVDRPWKSWLKLKLQCLDLSGTVMWEEVVSNSSALTGAGGLKSASKEMAKRLDARIGQPGLVVLTAQSSPLNQIVADLTPSVGKAPAPSQTSPADEAAANQVRAVLPQEAQSTPTEVAQDSKVELPQGTLVRLVLIKPVDSKTAKVGDKLEFRVLEDVKVGDLVVIPRKSAASAIVAGLSPPKRKNVPGRITIRAEGVTLINNEVAALSGSRTIQSGNQNVSLKRDEEIRELIQSTAGLGVLFLPLFALAHGEYVVLPAGMELAAALESPVILERAGLLQMQPAPEEKRQGILSLRSTMYRFLLPIAQSFISAKLRWPVCKRPLFSRLLCRREMSCSPKFGPLNKV